MNLEEVIYTTLIPPSWRASHTFRPEVKTLADSMIKHGWLSPLVVWGDGIIVDGTTRWWLAQTNKELISLFQGMVPVIRIEGDEVDAMLAHVRLNRARGELIPRSMSVLVRDIIMSGRFDMNGLQKELRMTVDELSTLLDANLLKVRKIDELDYSKAWVPIESSAVAASPNLERPPNADR